MSGKDRSKDDDGNGGGGGGGGGGDDEDGEGEGEGRKISKGCSKRGKMVTLFRLRKGKRMMEERRKEEGVYVNSGCWWRRSKIPGCLSCLKEPGTLDSSGESTTSDPNSSEFTFDMLRDLIEKNDFYSKECNTHLD